MSKFKTFSLINVVVYGVFAMLLKYFLLKANLDIYLVVGGLLLGVLSGAQEALGSSEKVFLRRLLTIGAVLFAGFYFGYR